jgi:hypothetical protein
VSHLASRPRSWLRHGAQWRSAPWPVIVVASSSFALFAAPNAGPAVNHDPPPIIEYTISGIRGTSGWYRGSGGGNYVVLRWTVHDPGALVIVTSGCDEETIDGPHLGSTRTCMAWSDNGMTSVTTNPIKIDADPPTAVVGNASRPLDQDGWYNHPVTVTWSGHDATSGIASCTSLTYRGPDRARKTLTGSCIDAAGNRSGLSRFVLNYDATPPHLGDIVVRRSDRLVSLRWSGSRDAHFLITRSPGKGGVPVSVVYRGARRSFSDRTVKSGVKYHYTLRATDRAGNTAAKTVRATARPPLFAPAPDAGLRSPRSILFAWEAVPETSYYNLQLWIEGAKVLSAWPSFARYRLVGPWVYAGVSRYLRAGRYTWYVWPGRGPRSLGAYRPLLGSSTFVVIR